HQGVRIQAAGFEHDWRRAQEVLVRDGGPELTESEISLWLNLGLSRNRYWHLCPAVSCPTVRCLFLLKRCGRRCGQNAIGRPTVLKIPRLLGADRRRSGDEYSLRRTAAVA